MRELPTGTFINRDSAVHRADARLKLVLFIAGVVYIVCCSAWWMYLIAAAALVALTFAARLKPGELLMPIARAWPFLVIIAAMNFLFFGAGGAGGAGVAGSAGEAGEALFALGPLAPSLAGLEQGVRVALNVGFVLVLGGVFTMTTSPTAITTALEFLLKPLGLLHVPVRTVSLIVSVAIQFIPTLLEETTAIKQAQTARGAAFDSPNLLKRAAAIAPLVVPIFVAAFRRADELALAMEARGYRTS